MCTIDGDRGCAGYAAAMMAPLNKKKFFTYDAFRF